MYENRSLGRDTDGPKEVGEIEGVMQLMRLELDQLREVEERLSSRLNPVLRPMIAKADKPEPRQRNSPLGQELQAWANIVQTTNEKLRNILDAIAL